MELVLTNVTRMVPIPRGFTNTLFPGLRSWLEADTEEKVEQEGTWQQEDPEARRKWSHQVQTQSS